MSAFEFWLAWVESEIAPRETRFWLRCFAYHCAPIPLFKTFELRSVNLSAASIGVKDKDNPKVFNLISVCVDN